MIFILIQTLKKMCKTFMDRTLFKIRNPPRPAQFPDADHIWLAGRSLYTPVL